MGDEAALSTAALLVDAALARDDVCFLFLGLDFLDFISNMKKKKKIREIAQTSTNYLLEVEERRTLLMRIK